MSATAASAGAMHAPHNFRRADGVLVQGPAPSAKTVNVGGRVLVQRPDMGHPEHGLVTAIGKDGLRVTLDHGTQILVRYPHVVQHDARHLPGPSAGVSATQPKPVTTAQASRPLHKALALPTRSRDYLSLLADAIRREAGDPAVPAERGLYLRYALLARAKGTAVSAEDVHDAWVSATLEEHPGHPSIRPYADLAPAVQALDASYVRAIRAVVARQGKDVA